MDGPQSIRRCRRFARMGVGKEMRLDVIAGSGEAIVFELPISVQPEDIDTMGHVNNIVYLRWVQDAATAHWMAAATEEQKAEYAWVVVRHEIDYLRPAVLGDELA